MHTAFKDLIVLDQSQRFCRIFGSDIYRLFTVLVDFHNKEWNCNMETRQKTRSFIELSKETRINAEFWEVILYYVVFNRNLIYNYSKYVF